MASFLRKYNENLKLSHSSQQGEVLSLNNHVNENSYVQWDITVLSLRFSGASAREIVFWTVYCNTCKKVENQDHTSIFWKPESVWEILNQLFLLTFSELFKWRPSIHPPYFSTLHQVARIYSVPRNHGDLKVIYERYVCY